MYADAGVSLPAGAAGAAAGRDISGAGGGSGLATFNAGNVGIHIHFCVWREAASMGIVMEAAVAAAPVICRELHA